MAQCLRETYMRSSAITMSLSRWRPIVLQPILSRWVTDSAGQATMGGGGLGRSRLAMPTDRDHRYDLRPQLQPLVLPAWALAAGIAAAPRAGLPASAWAGAALLAGALAGALAIRARGRG